MKRYQLQIHIDTLGWLDVGGASKEAYETALELARIVRRHSPNDPEINVIRRHGYAWRLRGKEEGQ